MVFNEIQVLKSVFHPGIVEMYEIIQEKESLIIILEYLAGGTLY
jgi:serine/threonine protein kinase